jgi:two-component system, cell cycle sensor histidine kinase and response regulator CckA
MVRRVALKILERHGYQILEASSGDEALEMAAAHKGTIDLLLTDVVMPGMNGKELATELLKQQEGIRVLYSSGYGESVIAHEGVLDEGVNFIAKPYSIEDLLNRIKEVLG